MGNKIVVQAVWIKADLFCILLCTAIFCQHLCKYGGKHMELRVLKYFLSVARNENISKAAEELHLTQPTLSRQLSELEDELGTKLFVRGKRRTTLTEEGIFLKERAREIVALADKTVAQFLQTEENIAGEIYIGCGETAAMQEVIRVMAALRQSYPHILFHIFSGNEESITDMLQKGLVDFGVVCRGHVPAEYVYLNVAEDSLPL